MKTTKEIKVYKPLVWVRVAFGPQIEVLYWEGTEENFKQKRATLSYIYFSLHNRNVPEGIIKDFGQVKDVKNLSREWRISHLTDEQKTEIKELANKMLKNIGREPTDSEFDSMIKRVVHGEEKNSFLNETLNEHQRFKTILVKKRFEIAKIITGKVYGFNDLKQKQN